MMNECLSENENGNFANTLLAAGWIPVSERMPPPVTAVLVFGWCCDVCHNIRIAEWEDGVQFTQRWIPVEEEKPELYTPVFVKMSYNFFNMDSFAIDCCYWNGESWINAIRQQHSNGSVTHWRPIEYPIL